MTTDGRPAITAPLKSHGFAEIIVSSFLKSALSFLVVGVLAPKHKVDAIWIAGSEPLANGIVGMAIAKELSLLFRDKLCSTQNKGC